MPFLITLLLVVVVHLSIAAAAWTGVGLLADDHHMIGGAILRHRGDWTFGSLFTPLVEPGAATALYRPFIDLAFWIEQPLFGTSPIGYHVVNSTLHCGTAMTWFVLVRRHTGSLAAALACALLFVGWPAHSETTHWIAARTSLLSVFAMSLALVVFDAALRRTGARRAAGSFFAAVLSVLAVGSREGAVLVVPLASVLALVHAPREGGAARRAVHAAVPLLPIVLAVFAWLWWRASLLGTWGSGTHYGWQPSKVSLQSCLDWIVLCMAPVHRDYTAAAFGPLLWILHGGLLVLAVRALRAGAAHGIAAVGGVLLLLGYVGGIGLEKLDLPTLENVRYGYEPALGLCVLLAIGVASLPPRARGAALAVTVLAHALVLDGNRESWLRASSVYRRLQADVIEVARTTQQPIRVLQAPGVYDGAFALLNGYTETLFMQQTAPPATNLRGTVSSTQEWDAVLRELGAAAAAKAPPTNAYVVQWDDGALVPFELDAQWPSGPLRGVHIGYAWLPRVRPFVGSVVPVHVLVHADATLCARARTGGRVWEGPAVPLRTHELQCVALSLPLPADLEPESPVEVELIVRGSDTEHVRPLGVTVPTAR